MCGHLLQRLVEIRAQGRIKVGLRQAAPTGARLRQRRAGALQGILVDLAVAPRFHVGRQHAFQGESGAQLACLRRRLACGGDEEQGVAQHRLGQAGRALRQAAQLQIDQAKQLLDVERAHALAAGRQPGKRLHGEPEGARRRVLLRVGHQGQGGVQVASMLAPRCVILRLQEGQQRLFKAPAPCRVIGHRG
ncbi:hypothetical protein D3C72_992570 [compost metagenome]